MVRYTKTAIVFGSSREALLYFDHIVPVNLGLELLPRENDLPDMRRKDWPDFRQVPDGLGGQFLPPSLRHDSQFLEKFSTLNQATGILLLKLIGEKFGLPPRIVGISDGDYASIEKVAATAFYDFVDDFGLKTLPLDCSDNLFSEEDVDQSETVVSLASLRLIDADRCSWEQILEFRRDDVARDKLRRLRLFAYDNYSGKSKEYVEDDILIKDSRLR